MPIHFTCPHCGHYTLVADAYAGHSGPCGQCGRPIQVPGGFQELPPRRRRGLSGLVLVGLILAALFVVGIPALGIFAALLLPAVQAARGAARSAICINNEKQIGIALHNYEDANHVFPPPYSTNQSPDDNASGTRARARKPLHSWRVLLLPYINRRDLYDAIRLDEPWDSPYNHQFALRIPEVYRCPSDTEAAPGETSYVMIVGESALFNKRGPTRVRDCSDGLANTISIVEVRHSGINWMEPRDLDFDSMEFAINGTPGTCIGSRHLRQANVLMGDGAVRRLSDDLPAAEVRALVTARGGEPIDVPLD